MGHQRSKTAIRGLEMGGEGDTLLLLRTPSIIPIGRKENTHTYTCTRKHTKTKFWVTLNLFFPSKINRS